MTIRSIARQLVLAFLLCALIRDGVADEIELALTGWKKLDAATATTNAESTFTNTSAPPSKRTRKDKWAVQDQCQKVESDTKAKILSHGRAYSLGKNPAGEWQVVQLSSSVQLFDIEIRRKQAFSVYELSLIDLFSNSNYKFADWKTLDNGQIEFSITDLEEAKLNISPGPGKHQPAAFEKVVVRLDPASNCRVVEVLEDVVPRDGLHAKVTTTYAYDSDPFVPSTVRMVSNVSGAKTYSFEQITSNSAISHDPLKPAEFSLSHYGLAELLPNDSRVWPWVVFGIALTLVVGFLARNYNKTA